MAPEYISMRKRVINKLCLFLSLPLSLKIREIKIRWWQVKCLFFYSWRLRFLGWRAIIDNPIFWTPEFISIGSDVIIMRDCRIEGIPRHESGLQNDPHIAIGNRVIMQQGCHITAAGHLRIGDGTLMSFNISIQDTDHRYENIELSVTCQPLKYRATSIGDDCFIGARVSIQAGTHLGRHCIVGANSVVRGTFPDYCVLVGAPAKIVKRYDLNSRQWRRTDSTGEFVAN